MSEPDDEVELLRARVAQLEAELRQLRELRLGTGLAEREELLRETERLMTFGCWVWDARADEVVWSDELYRILGYDPATTPPSPAAFFARIHPDDLARIQANGGRAARDSRTGGIADRARVVRPDGEVRHVEVDGRALLNDDGSPSRIVGTIRDITDQLSAAVALDDARTLLEAIGRLRGLGTYVWNMDTGQLEWSRGLYDMLGVGRDVTPSIERFLTHVHPEDLAQMQTMISAADQVGDLSPSTTFRVVRSDGAILHVYAQSHLLPSATGQTKRLAGILLDISERHALESQLRQAQKMEAVGALAGGIAHDVNNYLTVALGNSELLSLDLPADDPAQELLHEISEASQRCRALIQRLLAFSRRQVVEPQVLAINEMIHELTALVGRLVGENIEVVLELDAVTGTIRADRTQIEQVLVNLVVNARDAMVDGGRLRLTSERVELDEASPHPSLRPGPYVRLLVRDTGPGIPESLRERVFDPFFTTKSEGQGSGLGLSTAFAIIEQSGGRLSLHSEPGYGACFEVLLPLVEGVCEARDQQPRPRTIDRRSGTILLVEDDEQVRRLTHSQLERGGYEVIAAASAHAALELAEQHCGSIDLLLTDMMMPGMSGPQLVEVLCARRPELVVGYMSGYSADRFTGRPEFDEVAMLQKPFTLQTLLSWVERLLPAAVAT